MIVVAAVDRSEQASEVVTEGEFLATALDVPLHVVHVLSNSKFRKMEQTSYEETGQPAPMDEVKQFASQHAADVATDVADEYTPVGLVGEASQMVTEYAERNDARYVVVGGRKRSPTGKALFGSVAQSILLNADCPVVSTIR
ncbi:universal stress protein [Halopenitus salinus]|uniref:Universal stress protein n=1 Tax=Halopenitus salinus TaxID=1198295 RepID=A0ABD5UXR0_9EURY